jgi:hypothetical protein
VQVRVGGGKYRRGGELCAKCASTHLRPVNYTLAADSKSTSKYGTDIGTIQIRILLYLKWV